MEGADVSLNCEARLSFIASFFKNSQQIKKIVTEISDKVTVLAPEKCKPKKDETGIAPSVVCSASGSLWEMPDSNPVPPGCLAMVL